MAGSSEIVRVLAIHAHPDDVEFQCAGTLALLAERGCAITIATMTAGDCGSAEMGPEEISRVRREEARRSAEVLGAQYHCLEFLDLLIAVDADSRRRVTEAVRRARPDIVLTAPPVDYMSDHEMTSRLVRDACFAASVPNFSTHQWEPAPPLERIPHLYYVDAVEGRDWFGRPVEPDFYVDITTTYERKRKMLACHESQRNWLRKQHEIDEYMDSLERWSGQRGKEIGTRYAEVFRQHTGHPYPQDNLLLKLVEQDGRGQPSGAA
jgi:LmbE family N-acetylglucosaminyl deacetylase